MTAEIIASSVIRKQELIIGGGKITKMPLEYALPFLANSELMNMLIMSAYFEVLLFCSLVLIFLGSLIGTTLYDPDKPTAMEHKSLCHISKKLTAKVT